jgi:hypothetical protein
MTNVVENFAASSSHFLFDLERGGGQRKVMGELFLHLLNFLQLFLYSFCVFEKCFRPPSPCDSWP